VLVTTEPKAVDTEGTVTVVPGAVMVETPPPTVTVEIEVTVCKAPKTVVVEIETAVVACVTVTVSVSIEVTTAPPVVTVWTSVEVIIVPPVTTVETIVEGMQGDVGPISSQVDSMIVLMIVLTIVLGIQVEPPHSVTVMEEPEVCDGGRVNVVHPCKIGPGEHTPVVEVSITVLVTVLEQTPGTVIVVELPSGAVIVLTIVLGTHVNPPHSVSVMEGPGVFVGGRVSVVHVEPIGPVSVELFTVVPSRVDVIPCEPGDVDSALLLHAEGMQVGASEQVPIDVIVTVRGAGSVSVDRLPGGQVGQAAGDVTVTSDRAVGVHVFSPPTGVRDPDTVVETVTVDGGAHVGLPPEMVVDPP